LFAPCVQSIPASLFNTRFLRATQSRARATNTKKNKTKKTKNATI
jgi:hypothetical protein